MPAKHSARQLATVTRLFSRFRQLLVASLLLLPLSVMALSLGEIQANSRVGERLDATITIETRRGVPADQLLVSIAPRSVYERMGVYWEYFHSELQFNVERLGSRRLMIRVSSDSPITEPYVNFVLSARWPEGLITREYMLLLDMAEVRRGGGVSAPVPVRESAPVAVVQEPEPEPGSTSFQEPELSPQPQRAPAAVPRQTQQASASQAPSAQQASSPRQAPSSQPAQASGQQRWSLTTRAGDTLWSISERIGDDSGVEIKKVMQALYENNPRAFGRNANVLHADARMVVTMEQLNQAGNIVLPGQRASAKTSASSKQQQASGSGASNASESNNQTAGAANSAAESSKANSATSAGSNNDDSGFLSIVADSSDELATESTALAEAPAAAESAAELGAELGDSAEAAIGQGLAGGDQALTEASATADAIENRLNNLRQQYEVLSEKTEKLKELEASLNRRIAEQAAAGIDAPVTQSELNRAAENLPQSQRETEQGFFDKYRWLVFLAALLLLGLLVALALTRVGRMVPADDDEVTEEDWDDTAFIDDKKLDDDELAEIVRLKGERAFVENQNAAEDDSGFAVSTTEDSANTVEMQAAMYIAYERYDEAEEIINATLLDNPNNTNLKLQLLEIFAARQDQLQFGLLASRLRELNDDQVNATIDKLAQF